MAHLLLSRKNERELCLFGGLSSNIILGPTCSENDRHLCTRDERIRRDSSQTFFTKRSILYIYIAHEEQRQDKAICRILTPSFHALRQERLACIVTLGLSYGSTSHEDKTHQHTFHHSFYSLVSSRNSVTLRNRVKNGAQKNRSHPMLNVDLQIYCIFFL